MQKLFKVHALSIVIVTLAIFYPLSCSSSEPISDYENERWLDDILNDNKNNIEPSLSESFAPIFHVPSDNYFSKITENDNQSIESESIQPPCPFAAVPASVIQPNKLRYQALSAFDIIHLNALHALSNYQKRTLPTPITSISSVQEPAQQKPIDDQKKKRKLDTQKDTQQSLSEPEPLKKDGKWTCPFCNYQTSQRRSVVTHIRTHTKETPYQCPYCPLAMSQACNMKRHMQSHTGKKPYECIHCLRAYDRKYLLTRHIKNSHPELLQERN